MHHFNPSRMLWQTSFTQSSNKDFCLVNTRTFSLSSKSQTNGSAGQLKDADSAVGRKASEVEVLRLALRCYRAMHPTMSRVPIDYVVPEGTVGYPEHLWGLKLGQMMNNMVSSSTNADSSVKVTTPQSMDIAGNILDALKCYRALNPTEIRVPYHFIVPQGSSEYPEHLWGMKLGQIVHHMIIHGSYVEQHEKVKELGFSLERALIGFRIIDTIDALHCYRALHPIETAIPPTYVVPEGSADFPKRLWGLKLGETMNRVLNEGMFYGHRIEMKELGFSMRSELEETDFSLVREALACYRAAVPDARGIHETFVLSKKKKGYPEHLRGMKLGMILKNIIFNGAYRDHHDEVRRLGYDMSRGPQKPLIPIYEAFRFYRSLNPTATIVPETFVVPTNSSEYPQTTWGVKLGQIMYKMCYYGIWIDLHDRVRELGFRVPNRDPKEAAKILQALRCYRVLYPTASRVPADYVVPEATSYFPKHLWGMRLGEEVHMCRYYDGLRELGFEWQNPKSSTHFPDLVVEALRCYRLLNPKQSRVPKNFVVPRGSLAFPEHLWGIELGYQLRKMVDIGVNLQHLEEVRELGYSIESPFAKNMNGTLLEALRCYRKSHPTVVKVHQHYVVPRESPDFPEHLWGACLGEVFRYFCINQKSAEYRDAVRELGFAIGN